MERQYRMIFKGDKGYMMFDGKKAIFQNKQTEDSVKEGIGVIDVDSVVDKSTYAFADMTNVSAVIPAVYNTVDFFANRGVPIKIYKATYGDSVLVKEEYHDKKVIIKAFDADGNLLIQEYKYKKNSKKADDLNIFYCRIDNVIKEWVDITDDIDVLQEVTGLNVFEINIDKVKVALEGSNSIVKGEENGLQFIKFAITTQSASEILGDTYHVFDGMSDFSGFMFFYIDSDGYLAKFGYDSSFSEKSGEEKASVDATCEYTFSNINKTDKILAPGWVSKLQPEEIDTVYYIKDKVSYAFIYEESESTNGYGYKFYWVESTEDVDKPVAFADVPSKINGVDVTDISRTILIFGKGAEVMVLPETINYLPYAQEDVKATIFSKCDKFSEDIPEGITAYTAGEWEYVNGVPTVKGK